MPTPMQIVFNNFTGTWTVPAGVTSISAVAVGSGYNGTSAGGSGGAGNLVYSNAISVTPGENLSILCGTNGTYSTISRGVTKLVRASYRGSSIDNTVDEIGDVKNRGGSTFGFGGGGAAGYSGNGGRGDGQAGLGGGASGANGYGCGGGVGLLGEGTSGAATTNFYGNGGSSGTNGTTTQGGSYGGGSDDNSHTAGPGGIRIIWGAGRAYPSTNTADQFSTATKDFAFTNTEALVYAINLRRTRSVQQTINESESVNTNLIRGRTLATTINESTTLTIANKRNRNVISSINESIVLSPSIVRNRQYTTFINQNETIIPVMYRTRKSGFTINQTESVSINTLRNREYVLSLVESSNISEEFKRARNIRTDIDELISYVISLTLASEDATSKKFSFNIHEVSTYAFAVARDLKISLLIDEQEAIIARLNRIKQFISTIAEIETFSFSLLKYIELGSSVQLTVEWNEWANISSNRTNSIFNQTTNSKTYTFSTSSHNSVEFSLLNT